MFNGLNLSSRYHTGRWSQEECKRFEEAYLEYGNDWKKVARIVGTRRLIQVRSHAQKCAPKLLQKDINSLKQLVSLAKSPDQSAQDSILGNDARIHSMCKNWVYHSIKSAHYLQLMQCQHSGLELLQDSIRAMTAKFSGREEQIEGGVNEDVKVEYTTSLLK